MMFAFFLGAACGAVCSSSATMSVNIVLTIAAVGICCSMFLIWRAVDD